MDLGFLKQGNGGTFSLPLYRYLPSGERVDNITDWGLEQFRARYAAQITGSPDNQITKLDIFHYSYAVLHDPAYRKKYELNLRREFPRIPLYDDFWCWADWGKSLMDMHLGYETAEAWPLVRIEVESQGDLKSPPDFKSKPKLKADKVSGTILIDKASTLTGIPPEAWEYKLGNRSALEWVLDQYKEKKPGDPTIAEKFDTYRFADYKERVIDLLCRVCTVSVETMKIVRAMAGVTK